MNVKIFGLLFLLIIYVGDNLALYAQEDEKNLQEQNMTLMSSQSEVPLSNKSIVFKDAIKQRLHLRIFEAAIGDLSLCSGDEDCIKRVKRIKSLQCLDLACNGKDATNEPIACLKDISGGKYDKYSIKEKIKLNTSICPFIKSPSNETRNVILSYLSNRKEKENKLFEMVAYIFAFQGSVDLCEKYLKNSFGPYGSQWNVDKLRALSGCRILGRQSKREQEENDFYTWAIVLAKGQAKCSEIVNAEIRQACNTPSVSFYN